MDTVPALRKRPPVKIFTPERIRVPASILVKEPTPLATPESVKVPPANTSTEPPFPPKFTRRLILVPLETANVPPLKFKEPLLPKFWEPLICKIPPLR